MACGTVAGREKLVKPLELIMNLRTPPRFAIIPIWIEGRKQRREFLPAFNEIFHYLTQPSTKKRAMRAVQSITEEDGQYVVALKGYKPLIYWPVSLGHGSLQMILNEQFDPYDWHYYQIDETRIRPDAVALDCGAAEGLF